MDPNAILKELRIIAKRIMRRARKDPGDTNGLLHAATAVTEDAIALAERFQALDTWLKNGNFPPKDWHANIDRLTRDVLKRFACNRHAYNWMNEVRERFMLPALTEADYAEERKAMGVTKLETP